MQVATWNILHGINLQAPPIQPGKAVVDLEGLVSAAKSIAADVLAVQEVDQRQPRSNHVDQAQIISQHSDLPNYKFAATLIGDPDKGKKGWIDARNSSTQDLENPEYSKYGVALFSKYPVLQWYQLHLRGGRFGFFLPFPKEGGGFRLMKIDDEPRVVLAAKIQTPLGNILVATTHLSFQPFRNITQFRETKKWFGQFQEPKVLLGDFNLPHWLIKILTAWRLGKKLPTFPDINPRVQFDHILCTRQLSIANESTTKMAVGDHLLLQADIRQ